MMFMLFTFHGISSLASSPGHSLVFNVNMLHAELENVGVAWGRG